MKRPFPRLPIVCLALLASLHHAGASTTVGAFEAIAPAPRLQSYEWMPLARWFELHAQDVAQAEAGEAKVVFLGDSITEGWAGQKAWSDALEPLGAVNFGIGGDMTQNVLWRLEHGGVSALQPKAVVLLIGTNNFGLRDASPAAVALGVRAVVLKVRQVFPEAKLLLFGIFPRGEMPDTPIRRQIAAANADLAALHDGETILFEDIGPALLEPDGRISPEIMPDYLHLSPAGYDRWAKAILPYLKDWTEAAR